MAHFVPQRTQGGHDIRSKTMFLSIFFYAWSVTTSRARTRARARMRTYIATSGRD